MNLDTSIMDAYLQQEALETATLFQYVKNKIIPDPKRKDVVVELYQRIKHLVTDFPLYNHDLFHKLFTNYPTVTNNITLVLCVGEAKEYTFKKEINQHLYIFIDLLLVANFTRFLDEMEYIINNDLTKQIAIYCIDTATLNHPQSYREILNHRIFRDGLANWIAWNKDVNDYKFQNADYEEQKTQSFGMLANAYELDDPRQQQMILFHLLSASFWEQFTTIAGMFFYDDIYHSNGIDGIVSLYRNGDHNFIDHIFGL